MSNGQNPHIVAVPAAFNIIRGIQVVLSIIVLGLSAYGVSLTWFGGQGFGIFVVIWTWITCGYYLLTFYTLQAGYNCWAVLALECWAVLWWLCCWAWFAAWAAAYNVLSYHKRSKYYSSSSGSSSYVTNWKNQGKTVKNCTAAAAGIGALIWILFIATLIMYSIAVHRHRRSGAPYRAGGQWRGDRQVEAKPVPQHSIPMQPQQPTSSGAPQQYN